MSTALVLMLIASALGFSILNLLNYAVEESPEIQSCIALISIGLLFQPALIIDYNFQAQVKAKYSSIAKTAALGISSLTKLTLVWADVGIIPFAAMYALDQAIVAAALIFAHHTKKQPWFFAKFQKKLVMPILKSAWPMVLAAIAATLYMRVDQIMIKEFLGTHELGLYSAAVKIYEGWIIIPYVLSISALPAIVKLKNTSSDTYEKNMAMLFSVLIWSSAACAAGVSFFSGLLIKLTYGESYIEATNALTIIMWATTFAALGSVTARYLTAEGMERKIASRTAVGLLFNVALNLLLIPKYGIEGAAISTLITLFIANYSINYFDKNLKELIRISNNSITLGWIKK